MINGEATALVSMLKKAAQEDPGLALSQVTDTSQLQECLQELFHQAAITLQHIHRHQARGKQKHRS